MFFFSHLQSCFPQSLPPVFSAALRELRAASVYVCIVGHLCLFARLLSTHPIHISTAQTQHSKHSTQQTCDQAATC